MNSSGRSYGLRVLHSALLGVFCLPTLIYGGYLLYCWIKVHTSDVYYTNYWYGTAALIFLSAGAISLAATWFATWRRSFYGMLVAVPIILGLAAMVEIPNTGPRANSMIADSNYVSMLRFSLQDWYENKEEFPANEDEFRDAMAKGAIEWKATSKENAPTSAYLRKGEVVPYDVTVEKNARGPRVSNVSQRPGTVHYCVSQDLQEYWLTMTELQGDFGKAASVKRMGGQPHDEVLILHASGKDYSAEKR